MIIIIKNKLLMFDKNKLENLIINNKSNFCL